MKKFLMHHCDHKGLLCLKENRTGKKKKEINLQLSVFSNAHTCFFSYSAQSGLVQRNASFSRVAYACVNLLYLNFTSEIFKVIC